MNKERDYYFDNLKAILIVLVVVGHMIEPMVGNYIYKTIYTYIYLFHMPLFLFVSGYFSKNIKIESMKKVLITYIIFQTLYGLLAIYVLKENYHFAYFYPYWIMWYLFALFFMQLTLPIVLKFKYALLGSFIFGVLIGYDNSASYYFSLSRIIVFYPYFLMGYYFDKEKFIQIGFTKNFFCYLNKKVISAIAIISLGVLVYYLAKYIDIRLLYSSYPYKALGLDLHFAWIYRILSYLAAIALSFLILNLVPNDKNIFSNIGKNTLSIYLLHGFIVKLLITSNFYSMFLAIPLALAISYVLSLEVFNKLINFTKKEVR